MRLGGGGGGEGGTISDSIFGEGGKRHFFLLNLYNFKNIGGGGGTCPPAPPPLLRGPCKHSLLLSVALFLDKLYYSGRLSVPVQTNKWYQPLSLFGGS